MGNVAKRTTLKLYVGLALVQIREIAANKGQGLREKKKFHEVNEKEGGDMDDLSDQVQALFYNEVHFNAMNVRMHTILKCVTPDDQSSDQVFKIDTGADGNLMRAKCLLYCFQK